MEIAGYIVYGIGIILAITWMIGIRTYTKSGQGVTMSTVNTTMLFIVSLVVVPILNLTPLHLLWMYPASFILGMLSLAFPFSLLSIPGNIVAFIACAGLNQEEVQNNKDRIQRGLELVHSEGLTVEEAKKRLEEEGY
jgi:hypothetical protein